MKKIEKELEEFLSKGADERIFIDKTGLTKYGLPLYSSDLIIRGSCTCNPASTSALKLMEKFRENSDSDKYWLQKQEETTQKLKKLINQEGEDEFEIFYAPSGTDLIYLPILMAKLIRPKATIHNIFSCIEELGSGTKFASECKFYSNTNQFGDSVPKAARLEPDTNIKSIFLNARTPEGKIKDPESAIKEFVKENPDSLKLINLVYGSKSGIEDNLSLIDRIKGPNIFYTIDLCQFRHSKEILNMLIKKNAILFITGSKFYQSPPFSGALLLPKQIYKRLEDLTDYSSIKDYGQIFSRYDFPKPLRNDIPLPDEVNKSRIFRWACALSEIEKFNKLSVAEVRNKISGWRKAVVSTMAEYGEYFELMPQQDLSNKTILSFRVIGEKGYLNHEELRSLYFKIVKSDYSADYSFSKISIGQPVAYGDKSFLRLAIGSKNIREFVLNEEKEFVIDKQIIKIIVNQLKSIDEK